MDYIDYMDQNDDENLYSYYFQVNFMFFYLKLNVKLIPQFV